MKNYMLFLREDLHEMQHLTEEQNQEQLERMLKWAEALSRSGNFISGEPLEPEVRLALKDEIVHDGPFVESKEAVSGYLIISAANIDQAAQLAQGCPLIGSTIKSIEVRPIMKY